MIIAGLPMFGDYFTQQLLANTVGTRMIGNAIIDSLDMPIFVSRGSALILVLMALLVVPIVYYLRSTSPRGPGAGGMSARAAAPKRRFGDLLTNPWAQAQVPVGDRRSPTWSGRSSRS